MMDITRNQFFLAGLVLFLLGIQFRTVDSFVLTPELTQFLARRSSQPAVAAAASTSLLDPETTIVRKTVRPPDFLGWALGSIGAVLILHSWAMKKPGAA